MCLQLNNMVMMKMYPYFNLPIASAENLYILPFGVFWNPRTIFDSNKGISGQEGQSYSA